MRGLFAKAIVVGACLGLAAALAPVSGWSQQASQVSTAIGIDADPTGNEAALLGEIDPCVSVAAGQTFDVDIVVTDVVALVAWQATLHYDPSVVTVAAANVELFLAGAEPGRTLNLSDSTPDADGSYMFGVLDATSGGQGHTGSGLLARVTLQAMAAGTSFLTLDEIIFGDPTSTAIGDVNGDDMFDGTVGHAQVWVDEACPSTLPTPIPSPSPTSVPTVGPTVTPPSEATPTPPPATGEPTEPITPGPASEGGNNGGGFSWAIVAGATAGAVVVGLALGFAGGRLLRRE